MSMVTNHMTLANWSGCPTNSLKWYLIMSPQPFMRRTGLELMVFLPTCFLPTTSSTR